MYVAMNERFVIIRKNLNLSQKEMAEKLDVRQATISDIERGRTEMSNKIVSSLYRVYNVSLDWLYTGRGDMFIRHTDNENIIEANKDFYNDYLWGRFSFSENDFEYKQIVYYDQFDMRKLKVFINLTLMTLEIVIIVIKHL